MNFDADDLTPEQQRAAWATRFGTGWVPFYEVYGDHDFAILATILRTQKMLELHPYLKGYRLKTGQEE